MSIVWSNPESDTNRDGQIHPARTLASALLGLPSSAQITQQLKSPEVRRVSIWLIALRSPTPLRYAAEFVTAIYNALVSSMTRELVEQKEQLVQTERVAAWRELARRLAHELKNPLFPLQLTVENLLRARQQSPEIFEEIFRESSATLLAEISNLKAIISRFSEFSKMPQPQSQSLSLNESARAVARLFQAQFQTRERGSIDCKLELDDQLPEVPADPDLLHRAISNLVLNAMDAMSGAVPEDVFKDKLVFLGATALGIGDLRSTPFQKQDSDYTGVEIHANILDNLLHSNEPSRTFLTRGFREEIIDVAFIVIFGMGLGFWFGRIKPLYSTISVALVLSAFGWFVYFAFAHWGRWLTFVVPAFTLVANYAAITSFRVIFEEREKRKIRKTFGQYLSPGVIALIEKDPGRYIRPGGEVKELTVMFSDIRGFTTLSEGLTPDELVRLLNEYLGAMTDVLFKNLGTLDKYIGDAIMAFWGSPYPQTDHAYCACTCALEMFRKLDELNAKWKAEGRRTISIGVGLNTGPVNVGNMGSDKRLAWTVMGDNVNLASRLEGMTKEYRSRIIISEFTFRQVAHQFVCREVDKIRVKGKNQPVTIYELMAPIEDHARFSDLLSRFEDALAAYRTQDWRHAAGKFGELLAAYPDDGPTQILLQRAMEFMEESPEPDWDGVYVMKSK